jgi:hypothetical protein
MKYEYCCYCTGKENPLRWVESHRMVDHDKLEITCPKCKEKAIQYFGSTKIIFYFKGACYERKNYADCKRQMDLNALKENDPYAEHRLPGEVEHVVKQYYDASHTKKPTGKAASGSEALSVCSADGCTSWTTNRCARCQSPLCTECDSSKKCSCIKEDVEPPTREELIKLLAEE